MRGRLPAVITWAALAGVLAFMAVYAGRAAFHSDEYNVLLHAEKFFRLDVANPGRPGLLWAVLAPWMALESPGRILLGSRMVSWLAVACTGALVLVLARPRESEEGWGRNWRGVVALGLLFSAGTFATHCIEVRTDSFTTPLALAAVLLLWNQPRRRGALFMIGPVLCAAAALLISQKAIYASVGIAGAWVVARPTAEPDREWWRWRLRDAALALGGVGLLVAAWYASLAAVSSTGMDFVDRNLSTATNTAFSSGIDLGTKASWLWDVMGRALPLYGLGLVGIGVAAYRREGRTLALGIVALVMLGVIFVHRGFFPYYIASIAPLLAVPAARGTTALAGGLAALAAYGVPRPWAVRAGVLPVALALGLAAWTGWPHIRLAWEVHNGLQLSLASDVHEMVGEPAPFLAGIGMVPGYRELGGYLTGETRGNQRRKDPDFIATRMEDSCARFFVRTYMTRDRYLTKKERRLLYRSYLPVRPNLYLYGARVVWDASEVGGHREVELCLDGPYTVRVRGEGASDLTVDDQAVADGDVIQLSVGSHQVQAGQAGGPGELWLLSGTGIEPEAEGQHVDYSLHPKDRTRSRSRYQRYDGPRKPNDLYSPPSEPASSKARKRLKRHREVLEVLDAKHRSIVLIEPPPTEVPSPL
jgi:hypothetical protein